MVSEAQAARNAATEAAWEEFRANPGYTTYMAAVRSGYINYGEALEEQDLGVGGTGVGGDIQLLGGAVKDEALPFITNATLDVVRGLGGAIIDGLDYAYDAAREKLEGKEPDVVAGVVVVTLTVLTGVYLFHSAKSAMDAF